MKSLLLTKEKLPDLVNAIASKQILFGPKEENSYSSFKQIHDFNELDLNYLLSRVSPKSIIFKQTETLFKFVPGRKGSAKSIDIPNERSVIFAIRPCDARGISMLDKVFDGDYVDPFYLSRRNNTILVGLTCNQPEQNCFCTSFEDSPGSTKNVDVLLTEMEDNYLIEIITEKGQELFNEMNTFLSEASVADKQKRDEIKEQAISLINRKMNLKGIVPKLDKMFDHVLWRNTAYKCIGCGICTYLCPTCNCFDMQDESTLKEGARIRVWDSCMYPEYTMHASGHNPRPARMNRVRNRVYHKFSYFPKNEDDTACTGCARCIDYCPANIDIIDLIEKVEVLSNE
ncbi:MAG: 4Fe-4S dicluster domain-containing protein [Candidatus Heimdallarchaeaceae archaeon]